MKSSFLLSLFALIAALAGGQNIAKLDSINGFKIFKLGTSKNLYTDYLKNSHYNQATDTYSVEVGKYPSLGKAFGSDVSTVFLHFNGNDNLETITIPYRLLPDNKNTDSAAIFKEARILLSEFGPASETSLNDLAFRYYRWNGKKTRLNLNIRSVT